MKKTLTLMAALLLTAATGIAQTVNVHKTDGTVITYPADEVDFIDFTPAPDNNPEDGNGNAPKGVEAVDLGLPSGTLWANMNVGATTPEDYGDYFAWGETSPKSVYNWETYKWCNGSYETLTKYCTGSDDGTVDNKTQLDLADDAARANWGGDWRMPTEAEVQELLNSTTSEWIIQNGVQGRKFTSKINGASVFLPAAGYRYCDELYNAGSYGYYYGDYWSSTLYESVPYGANCLGFGSGSAYWNVYDRNGGLPVRPVR